jgi:phosphoglycerate dehydrogenase-like enzyme
VDEDALLDVLEEGKICGAAADVFDIEPLPKESRWRTVAWGK